MQTSYIYSVSRVNALSQFLLNKTDIERLLVATPGDDLQQALKETYLAPYVTHVPDGDVALAIEQTLIEAKRLIHRIAPNGDMFRILWVHYDIHNLRVFAKATAKQLTLEECAPYLSKRGIYEPDYLHAQVESDSLDALQSGWQQAYRDAVEYVRAGAIDKVDGVFDALYFETSKRITKQNGDRFMSTYMTAVIDFYNLKSRLRVLRNPEVAFTPTFIDGGSFGSEQLETIEDVRALLARYGGPSFWTDALDAYESTGNTTQLDVCIDEYLITLAKEASYDMFSSGSLVLYYLKCRQAAANIRAIVVGKNSGMNEADIRANLRLMYVND